MAASRSVSSQLVVAVIAAGTSEFLRQTGYKRIRNRFYLVSNESTAHIDFQSSHWNTPTSARFTINLGRYFPSVAKQNDETVVLEPSKQKFMHVGIRIGHLMPMQEDHWWTVSAPAQVPQVGREVMNSLRDYAMPYLEMTSTLEGVAEFSGYIPRVGKLASRSRVSALVLLGRKEEAEAARTELERPLPRSTSVARTPTDNDDA